LLRYGGEYVYQELAAYQAAYRARLVKGLALRACTRRMRPPDAKSSVLW
jgi:hypothetical protein